MPQFKQKPIVITAEQYNGPESIGPEDTTPPSPAGVVWQQHAERLVPIIPTLEGSHFVSPGDWIITGVKGERYACKPDIFAATYEPA